MQPLSSYSLLHYTEIFYSSITPIRRCQGYYEVCVCEPLAPQSDMKTSYLHSSWLLFHDSSPESGQVIALSELVSCISAHTQTLQFMQTRVHLHAVLTEHRRDWEKDRRRLWPGKCVLFCQSLCACGFSRHWINMVCLLRAAQSDWSWHLELSWL